ncbi:MAG: glutamine-hydrolyzing carbamoyl-phosphate synthase small subunit [Lachnospiraceae bacterium]|nr:glutamine-hydrolyzing carbamoyl-phosphate synthase small subunit [Lachnospiraceae bacterium]MBO7634317.1 glutamine-hydrolyzing carbamoyl-phosphate synthase small subunit [Lachnospiraceae bacterium]
MNKKIVLEDGLEFVGTGFGSPENRMVELVFNTSMVGYQEIVSDPSYTGQAVVMTYPLIGNYGMCDDDYETLRPSVSGLIVREYCEKPSNFRYTRTLEDVMKEFDIVGVYGIDTRTLGRYIRNYGTCRAYICDAGISTEDAVAALKAWVPATDFVAQVSTRETYDWSTAKISDLYPLQSNHVVAIDCGMKRNIPRSLARRGCKVTVVPWDSSAEYILSLKPDGVFISNGPGDPQDAVPTIAAIKQLIGKVPIFGICLGHQIISLAYGADTYKLKFGHRGGNHPVKNLKTGKIEITSQNHSYAVREESLAGTGLEVTHINILDNTIEGVECKKDRVFSVQYHPESAPGPQDSAYLFDEFIDIMNESKGEGKADA